MEAKSIFVNLPIQDIERSRKFWEKLGFIFDEQFSNEEAICLVIKKGSIYSMLIATKLFNTFANRPVADGSTTQVLTAISVESRAKVDELVTIALRNGGSRYREAADYGWLYYDSFADLDGHQWEIMFEDPSQMKTP